MSLRNALIVALVMMFLSFSGPVHSQCVMIRDYIAGDSEDNVSKIYALIREKDYHTLELMLISGQATVIKKGTKIYRTEGGWFSSTVTIGASPKKWILPNDSFRCSDPGTKLH